MPPLPITPEIARNRIAHARALANERARAQAANKRPAAKSNAPKNLRYPNTMKHMTSLLKLKSTPKTRAPRNTAAVNYNKYANQLVQNRLKHNLPSQHNAVFRNKVASLVKNEYQKNHPTHAKMTNNSPYINRAIQKLRTELNRIRNTQRTNSSRPSSPPKSSKITLVPKLYQVRKLYQKKAHTVKNMFAAKRKANTAAKKAAAKKK